MNRWVKFKTLHYAFLIIILALMVSGCAKKETITFSAEIETVSENSVLVKTIDFDDFDKASVDLLEAEYDFKLAEGQIVEITILPEIRESYPVQVTGIALKLIKEAEMKISDYFPIQNDIRYTYEGMGNEFASYEVFADYTSESRLQQMVNNGGTEIARVYEIKDGKLIRVLSQGEIYYRENMLERDDGAEEVLLMEPLEKGTSWVLADGRQRTITGVSTEIKTSAGTYSAIEVVTEGKDDTNIDYYAKGVGLVKTIFQSGGMEVSSTLKFIEKNASREQIVQFYYPSADDGKIYYKSEEVSYHTNDSTGKILEEAYKGAVNETFGVVFPTGAAIKSLALDDEGKVRLDLNSAFVLEMNAGAEYESLILQCVANTFGHYYNAEKLILTIEGKPYESGHIKMDTGQSITVNHEGITEKSE